MGVRVRTANTFVYRARTPPTLEALILGVFRVAVARIARPLAALGEGVHICDEGEVGKKNRKKNAV